MSIARGERVAAMMSSASLAALAAVAVVLPSPAVAQALPPQPNTAAQTPSAPLGAAATATSTPTDQAADREDAAARDEPVEVNEVVVTAQRRSERLQTVPIAATVVSGEAWRESGNFGVEDLEKISPSLTFDTTTSTRNNSVRIRGIGTNTTSSGIEPSTSTVIDGVALIRSGQSSGSLLLDLERIEVLRGPQGTLFGKNASAGVVNITTRAPSDEFEFSADALATDDEEYQLRATVSGALSDSVSGRLSGFFRDYAGNVDNVFNGDRLNANESVGVRGKLLFRPNDTLSLLLTADYGNTDSTCCGRVLRVLDLTSPRAVVEAPFLLPVRAGPENTSVNNDVAAIDDSKSFVASAELNQELGEFTLTSITAYQEFNITQQLDDDQTSSAPSTGGQQTKNSITSDETVKGFTQEVRLTSPVYERFDYVLGVFFLDSEVYQTSTNFRRRLGTPATQQSTFYSTTTFRNYAAFGQVNIRPIERVTFLLGGRLTRDEVGNFYVREDDPVLRLRGGNVALAREVTEDDFSWKAGAEFEATRDLFFYATYAQGYKGPGFSIASDASALNPTIRPETADSYEVGAKIRLFDRRLSLNIAAFDATYSDYATTVFFEETRSTQLVNAAELRTKGVELEFEFRPIRALSIAGGVAYIDAGIDVLRTPCFPGQTVAQGCTGTPALQDVIGGELPNSPDYKGNVGATYTLSRDALPVDLIFRANYNYTGAQQFLINQFPNTTFGSYGIIDASVAAVTKDDRYKAELFVRNLTDEFYVSNLAGVSELTGSLLQFVPRDAERYFGLRLSYRH